MPTSLKNRLLSEALGAYISHGFELREITDDTLELWHNHGGADGAHLVDRFTQYATFASLQNGCQAHEIDKHGITYQHRIEP